MSKKSVLFILTLLLLSTLGGLYLTNSVKSTVVTANTSNLQTRLDSKPVQQTQPVVVAQPSQPVEATLPPIQPEIIELPAEALIAIKSNNSEPPPMALIPPGLQSTDIEVSPEGGVIKILRKFPENTPPPANYQAVVPQGVRADTFELTTESGAIKIKDK
ncbi:hypothetical protein [Methylomonas sp. AM2-LC]|uniref:hypothetical protein n=1 Tax=Methylomonas sp. AM2-LC TaxID=3153301 RepID=UPI003264E6E1